jgi:hypothetical protein
VEVVVFTDRIRVHKLIFVLRFLLAIKMDLLVGDDKQLLFLIIEEFHLKNITGGLTLKDLLNKQPPLLVKIIIKGFFILNF